ncbi:MAG: bifunctional oligoribonuclease/PAP phosphatase NrnA [Clostridia bacterium]|nr:bifunctional oligoribonuclease/PAP phosphatase NrnA [Clostridia bacterium]
MEKIAKMIAEHSNFAVFAHIKTDCDAVCSSLAMKYALASIGKKADVFIDSSLSSKMQSLPHIEDINNKTLENYDCYICLDTATIDRLGKFKYKIMKNRKNSCLLDHHATNEKYCKLNYVNETYSSTCELLFDFFKIIDVKITPEMAHLLLAGIYTDSGELTFSCTKPHTLLVASKLLSIYGGAMDEITTPIFRNQTMAEFKLNKLAYDRIKIYNDGKIAITMLDNKDFEELGVGIEETHGLVNIGIQIDTILISIFVSQDSEQEDCFYVSIRSKGNISARDVAAAFGGGGHLNAAGCKIFDTKQGVHNALLKAAQEVIGRC